MARITNTGQLATFSIIKTIIKTENTLAVKFTDNSFYEFTPKHKSSSFKGFPYIIINVPDTDKADDLLGDRMRDRLFEVEIILRVEYSARDKFTNYFSRLLTILDSSDDSFAAYGYSLQSAETDGTPEPVVIDQKEVIEGRIALTLRGEVAV